MHKRGVSRVFWITVVAVIGIPLGLDQVARSYLSTSKAVVEAKLSAPPTWHHQDFPRIGLSIDLPSQETRVGAKLDQRTREKVGYLQEYAGVSGDLEFDLARVEIRMTKPFSPDDYFDRIYDKIATIPSISDFHVVRGQELEWEGSKAFLMTCTFRLRGRPVRMHHQVRPGKNEVFYLQGTFGLDRAKEGEEAWSRMRDSVKLRPMDSVTR